MTRKESYETPPLRIIRDKAFARRMEEACDTHPHVPPYNYGRLAWVKDNLLSAYRVKVSTETVRKWFAGESRPRPDKMRKLAMLLKVDEAWLSLGITPEMVPDERQEFNATAPGVVNLVAGLIQLNGGHPAFPDTKDDRRANLLAVVGGKSYAFYVTLGSAVDNTEEAYRFTLPADTNRLVVIGAIQTGPIRFEFLRLDSEELQAAAVNRGGFSELTVKKKDGSYATKRVRWERMKNFREALAH